MLPFVGIAGLMVFGFVVLTAALIWDPLLRAERRHARAQARPSRPQRERSRRRALEARHARRSEAWGIATRRARLVARRLRSGVPQLAVMLRAWAIVIVEEWWPRLRLHARVVRHRWLTLESRIGQLILCLVVSLVGAYMLIVLVG